LRGPTGVINLSDTSNLFELSNSYPLRCTWNITVRSGRTILVKLMKIKLSSYSLCVDSYVLVCNHIWSICFWDWIPNSSSMSIILIITVQKLLTLSFQDISQVTVLTTLRYWKYPKYLFFYFQEEIYRC